MQFAFCVLIGVLACTTQLRTQNSPLLGNWQDATGSTIQIERCPSGICLKVFSLGLGAPTTTDVHNPDPALRARALCNLEIGSRFQLSDATHAFGGILYDPKSGRTYHGVIAMEGGDLKLHGYVGAPIFGRTEIWHRALSISPCCHAPGTP